MTQDTEALETTILDNITLWPLEPCHRYAIRLQISPPVPNVFDHFRFKNGRKLNSVSAIVPGQTPDTSLISGTCLYGGIIFVPFGHFIAESLHRLWPIYTDPGLLEARVVFHVWDGASFIFKTGAPSWMREIFDILGIAQSRLTLIDKPLTFEKLVVPVQGSLHGLGPISPRYQAIFPPEFGVTDRRPSTTPGRRIYVSRSEYIFSGSYLGETLVERILERDGGFEILHPQNHPVPDVLEKLQSCETAVFAEGSALHLLELCRRCPPNVFVICRRKKGVKLYRPMLHQMVSRFAFQRVEAELTPLDVGIGGRSPAHYNATALVDIASLVRRLADFCGIELREPSPAKIRQAQALSLLQYVLDSRSTREHTSLTELGRLLTRLRSQVDDLDMLPWSEH